MRTQNPSNEFTGRILTACLKSEDSARLGPSARPRSRPRLGNDFPVLFPIVVREPKERQLNIATCDRTRLIDDAADGRGTAAASADTALYRDSVVPVYEKTQALSSPALSGYAHATHRKTSISLSPPLRPSSLEVHFGTLNVCEAVNNRINDVCELMKDRRFNISCMNENNGKGAFLIPFLIMLVLEGIPLFLIEMAIGQRMRLGSLGVWNTIHPWLGGIGIASCMVTLFVALYYNVIITWVFFYFFNSIRITLPWAECPNDNGTRQAECTKASATQYFWYREALDASPSIEEPGEPKWWIVLCLLLAWIVVFFIVMKGIQSSGKASKMTMSRNAPPVFSRPQVVYFTSLFPYIVLTIFFVRGITLPGSSDGIIHMYKPKLEKLLNPMVWLDAATQVFYSFGLAFGSLIAFGSYNPPDNNCVRDVLLVSLCNALTAVYASVVIFSILGFKAYTMVDKCIDKREAVGGRRRRRRLAPPLIKAAHQRQGCDSSRTVQLGYSPRPYIDGVEDQRFKHDDSEIAVLALHHIGGFTANSTRDQYRHELPGFNASVLSAYNITGCPISKQLDEAAEGTGLAFIVFTQAIVELPFAPFWSLIFFLMLLSLGLGSQIGIMEGMLCTIFDIDFFKRISKPIITGVVCTFCFLVGLVFTTGAGEYWLKMFDSFAGTVGLVVVALLEMVSVVYIYGHEKFTNDIFEMTGYRPGAYWQLTWRYIGPFIVTCILVSSVIFMFIHPPTYGAWNAEEGRVVNRAYPPWVLAIAVCMILAGVLPIPMVALLRRFQCLALDVDIHQGSIRRIETTVSTKEMMSDQDVLSPETAPPPPAQLVADHAKFTIGDFDVSIIKYARHKVMRVCGRAPTAATSAPRVRPRRPPASPGLAPTRNKSAITDLMLSALHVEEDNDTDNGAARTSGHCDISSSSDEEILNSKIVGRNLLTIKPKPSARRTTTFKMEVVDD
ncbi:Sodium-dependent neutral amino acid transporter SLC6A17 [Eumeta japonica]|uniref:Sodium-dependent neutral amino acid transporter SLC6A17 n=1 Tax=Eumeta variegata TaxID=151549 RepID=A0A4C1ZJN1_EUMVA|nr:Sodium-dependent neutral amino acid transporter SLC6A17 [Eumeta japonica]